MIVVDAEAFTRLVAALPAPLEPALTRDDTVSTAFFQALRSGWTEDQLIGDAQATVRRGGQVGAVVTRFRTLAARSPVVRSQRSGTVERWVPPEVTLIPPSWVTERMALLNRIWTQHVAADDAEEAMRSLIEQQKSRL